MIRRFHDSLFAGHLGISRTVFRLQTRVYWPGLRNDVRTYIASCTVCIARKSPCPRRAPMGHVAVGRRWESGHGLIGYVSHVGKRKPLCVSYGGLLLEMDGGLPSTRRSPARSVADAFFSNIMCRFGVTTVIHSDQGREFETKVIHELCILGGAHKTKTTPYHPESDGLVRTI